MEKDEMGTTNERLAISLVIPIYNESKNIIPLYNDIVETMRSLKSNYEIIFIDDGSSDASSDVLKDLSNRAREEKIKLVSIIFRNNRGKSEALQAGFENAKGNIIITMDGDLQDDPGEIPKFIEKINEGYDVVSGWKFKRQDPITKIAASKVFNVATSWLTGVKMHDFNCCYKAYKRDVTKELTIYGDIYRYIPVILFYAGFKTAEIKVAHRPRIYGKSKYGARRFFGGFFDLITVLFLIKFMKKPLHFFGNFGILSAVLGFFVIASLYIRKFIFGIPIGNNQFLFLLGVLLTVIGFQFFFIGLLAELMIKLNIQSRNRVSHEHIKEISRSI